MYSIAPSFGSTSTSRRQNLHRVSSEGEVKWPSAAAELLKLPFDALRDFFEIDLILRLEAQYPDLVLFGMVVEAKRHNVRLSFATGPSRLHVSCLRRKVLAPFDHARKATSEVSARTELLLEQSLLALLVSALDASSLHPAQH